MSSKGRLISLPRTAGTMQNAQLLSQPIWIVTHPAHGTSRRTGSADGNVSRSSATVSSRISTIERPAASASCRSAAARCTLWVPSTTSTCGALAVTVSRSFWARHPATAICIPGLRSFSDLRWPRVP